jgi:hypothetical protein
MVKEARLIGFQETESGGSILVGLKDQAKKALVAEGANKLNILTEMRGDLSPDEQRAADVAGYIDEHVVAKLKELDWGKFGTEIAGELANDPELITNYGGPKGLEEKIDEIMTILAAASKSSETLMFLLMAVLNPEGTGLELLTSNTSITDKLKSLAQGLYTSWNVTANIDLSKKAKNEPDMLVAGLMEMLHYGTLPAATVHRLTTIAGLKLMKGFEGMFLDPGSITTDFNPELFNKLNFRDLSLVKAILTKLVKKLSAEAMAKAPTHGADPAVDHLATEVETAANKAASGPGGAPKDLREAA